MIRKFHEAKQNGEPFVSLWGSGGVRREFLHVDDMADASLFVLDLGKDAYDAATEPMLSHLNLGSGKDVTIRELANTIKQVTGFQGDIRWDASKPDGMPRKLLNVDKMKALGWQHTVELEPGLRQTYAWFVEHEASVRK
jgi:GDP-L-fucose synthase